MTVWDYVWVAMAFLFIYYNQRLWKLVKYGFDKLITFIETGKIK